MKSASRLNYLEELITRDRNFVFTAASLSMVLIMLLNNTFTRSPVIAAASSLVFLTLNTVFLGHALFEEEAPFTRFMLGAFFLTLLLGIISWMVMIAYNLDIVRAATALFIVAGCSSFMNRLKKKSVLRAAK